MGRGANRKEPARNQETVITNGKWIWVNLPALEYEGVWWLPETPDEKISGKITYDYGQNPTLSLNGMFGDSEGEEFFPIILGDCKGKKITLVRCFTLGTSTLSVRGMGSYQYSNFDAGYLCEGGHFPRREDIKFTRLSVKYSHLRDWLGGRVFNTSKNEETEQEYILRVPKNVPNEFVVNNYRLTIRGVVTRQHDGYKDSFGRDALFIVEPFEQENYDSLFRMIYHMKNFLWFAIGDDISILSIKGEVSGAQPWERVNILSAYTMGEKLAEQHHAYAAYGSPIKYSEIEKQMVNIFGNWLKITNELAPVYQLFFGTKEQKLYPVTEFLGLSQAIEAYHSRRFDNRIVIDELFNRNIDGIDAIVTRFPQQNQTEFRGKVQYWNRKSLRKRTKELCAQFQAIFNVFLDDEQAFISKFVDTRNYYTHYDPTAQNHVDDKELMFLTEKVRFMVIALLLKELGLDDGQADITMRIYASRGIRAIYS